MVLGDRGLNGSRARHFQAERAAQRVGKGVFEPDFALQRRHTIGVGRLAIAFHAQREIRHGVENGRLAERARKTEIGVERTVEQACDRGGELQLLATAEEVAVTPVDLGAKSSVLE